MNVNTRIEDIQNNFERDGFVVLPDFLSPPKLHAIGHEIENHYKPLLETELGQSLNQSDNFKQFECDVISWDPCGEDNEPFIALQNDAHLAQVTAACIGTGFTKSNSLVMWSIGGGKGQSWHQDCAPDDSAHFNLNRLFYPHNVAVEDGAIVVVPGSHRQGRIPPGGNHEPIAGEVALTPTAGTLVLLNGHVYHRVTPNRSGKPRVSINFRVFPEGVSPDVVAVGVYRGGAYDFSRREVVT